MFDGYLYFWESFGLFVWLVKCGLIFCFIVVISDSVKVKILKFIIGKNNI